MASLQSKERRPHTHTVGFQNEGHRTQQVHVSIEDCELHEEDFGAVIQPSPLFQVPQNSGHTGKQRQLLSPPSVEMEDSTLALLETTREATFLDLVLLQKTS